MFLKNINIRNFKQIESLAIKNIKQINLITGRNNCGKTSILEAICLSMEGGERQLPRDSDPFQDLVSAYIFRDLDFSKSPAITLEDELGSETRTLTIQPVPTLHNHPHSSGYIDTTKYKMEVERLLFSIHVNGELNMEKEIKLKQSPPPGELFSTSRLMLGLEHQLNKVVVRKALETIINILGEIEPNLKNIWPGVEVGVHGDTNLHGLVPVNILSGGIKRILAISVAIYKSRNKVVLIDEIESGLHYLSLPILWRAIFRLAKDNGVQLFATTYSYDCIKAFAQVYQEQSEDFISLYRIRNNRGKHRAFRYDGNTLVVGIEGEFEVR